MKNIIIDTDIGDDADDILALAYAATFSSLNILGVTTVFKNTQKRAQMASHVLALAGLEDVPVHAGEGHSLQMNQDINEVPCQFQTVMNNYPVSEQSALSFYQQTLETKKASIIAIGPLTNIAQLITQHPEVLNNIDEIVLMGGCFYRHVNEWNIVCDPEAADIVFRSGIPLRAVGLDVTTQCQFDEPYLTIAKENANTPLKALLIESCDAWFDHSGFTPILHDPLAIRAVAAPDTICFTPERVQIELNGTLTRGMTVCSEDGIWGREADSPNTQVASKLNYEQFTLDFLNQIFVQP